MTTTIGRPGEAGVGVGSVRLGKYALDAPLGAGGMAEVFRAHTVGAEGFERAVAIKRILPDASKNPAFSEMFIAEAKLSSRMQHPNIVSVLDFDRDHEGRLYLVMELVEGRDLDALIESGRLPFSVVIYTITETLRGLGYAHDLPAGADGVRGLVHRDVSPHNVLLSWNGAVKVSDFGIAKARAATAASASVTIKGKPAYMSPEQINGSPLDGRSDLFAVGVMLWQMMTGQYLFAAGTTTETLARVLFAPVPSPRTIVPEIPTDLEAITMRLLAKEPAQRYASAEDAIDDLLRCQLSPRDGRRELEQLLVARFPQKAPVRTGQRSRQVPEQPGALPQGTPAQSPWGTVPLPAGAMDAETRTTPATPAAMAAVPPAGVGAGRRIGLLVAGAIGVVVIGVVAIVIATSGGGKRDDGAERSTGTGGSAAGGVADSATASDAGVGTASSTTPDAAPIDAAPTDAAVLEPEPTDAAPPVDARRRPRSAGDAKGSGSGTIHEIPLGGQ